MPRRALIGITGKARSGKDTLANFIVASMGGYRYSFADPIRAMLHAGFGINMQDPYWLARKEDVIPALGKSPRQLMQTLGTEWGHNHVCRRVWLILANQVLLNRGPGMVLADVRFDMEAEWVRSLGGLVIHLERVGVSEVNPHVTEAGVGFHPDDVRMTNNGTLEELQIKVRELLA